MAVDGIGARRLLNQEAVVIRAVEAGVDGVGRVRIGREEWRAESATRVGIPEGAVVTVVDVREQVVDVLPQEVITSDNVVVSVDAVVYDEARPIRADTWGVRVKRVEIQRIDPPSDVMSAMHEQMKAERTRRATVTAADGERQAAITRAEGERQAQILRAEAVRQQQILEAEGAALAVRQLADAERYRQIATAEGEAMAIRSVYEAIHDGRPTDDLIAIEYLEALATVADGRATKILLPADTMSVMGSIAGIAELFKSAGEPLPAPPDANPA